MNKSILTLVFLLFYCAASAQDVTINGKLNFVNTNAYMVGVSGSDYLDVRGVNDLPILRFDRNTLAAYFMNGKVGIGTVTPAYTLDVAGIIGTHGFVTPDNSATYAVTIGRYSAGYPNSYISPSATSNGISFTNGAKSSNILTLQGASVGGGRVIVNSGGTIMDDGINALQVNGKIRARELKIEITGWPDYVFKSSHKLRSLGELEQYIRLNNHLPEIPSAVEAEKNGIEVGEMNKLLLKKVEELTLYLIEQNKSIEAQNKRIEAQNEQLNLQGKQIKALQKN